jgi:hypothetical protein
LSNKTEREWLKRFGIRPHKNSGRNMIKGDGSDSTFVWDVKEAAKSFTLNDKVWTKVTTDAYSVDPYKAPALMVIIGDTTKLAVVSLDVLITLRNQSNSYERSVQLEREYLDRRLKELQNESKHDD